MDLLHNCLLVMDQYTSTNDSTSFFSGTGLADFIWSRDRNSDNTPLTNSSFGGNVLITFDTRTLILVDPTAVVSVNDIIQDVILLVNKWSTSHYHSVLQLVN